MTFPPENARPPLATLPLGTRVFLLRHAESADPTVFHGAESDVDLSERGRRQAAALAPLLAARRPDVIVSSAMRRAVHTATPIAAVCSLPLHVEPELHERRVGPLSGTPTNDAGGVWPATLARWIAGDTGFAPPGAESYDDIRRRVLPVWQRLTAQHRGRTLVMVAHGIVCRVLLLNVLPGLGPADWRGIRTSNAGVNELLEEGTTWRAVALDLVPEAVRLA
jgi:broad specificity phosphatase PhoE